MTNRKTCSRPGQNELELTLPYNFDTVIVALSHSDANLTEKAMDSEIETTVS